MCLGRSDAFSNGGNSMAVLFRDDEGEPVDEITEQSAAGGCSICGRPADASWHGEDDIGVCVQCALLHLPALIADAMRARCDRYDCLKHALDQITISFWRGAA